MTLSLPLPLLLAPRATRRPRPDDPVARALQRAADDPEWLRFAVVGGGETGVALAAWLAKRANRALGRHTATISLVEAAPRILPYAGERLQRRTTYRLAGLGVDIWQRAMVVAADDEGLDIQAPSGVPVRLPARTVLWATGLKNLSDTAPRTGVTI